MDWATAIEPKQAALARIVATLFAMLGLASEGAAARMPLPLYRAVLRVLRPAESAVRRLMVAAARGIKVELAPVKPRPRQPAKPGTSGARLPSFPLFDPPHRVGAKRVEPRLHLFDGDAWVSFSPPPPAPQPEDGQVGTNRLSRRLAVIKRALDDLPGQAKRLARWQARQAKTPTATPNTEPKPTPRSPLRLGPPPGCRVKPKQEIDWLLWECHFLATDAVSPDTS